MLFVWGIWWATRLLRVLLPLRPLRSHRVHCVPPSHPSRPLRSYRVHCVPIASIAFLSRPLRSYRVHCVPIASIAFLSRPLRSYRVHCFPRRHLPADRPRCRRARARASTRRAPLAHAAPPSGQASQRRAGVTDSSRTGRQLYLKQRPGRDVVATGASAMPSGLSCRKGQTSRSEALLVAVPVPVLRGAPTRTAGRASSRARNRTRRAACCARPCTARRPPGSPGRRARHR